MSIKRVVTGVLAAGLGWLSCSAPAVAQVCAGCRPAFYGGDPGIKHEDLVVLELADKRNMYREEYAAIDRWIYAHAVKSTDPVVVGYLRREGVSDGFLLESFVDSRGCLIPQAVARQRELHAMAVGDDPHNYPDDWTHMVFATGPIEPELIAQYEQALLTQRAEYSISVPQWLADNPPGWAMVLPPEAGKYAGEVITLGAPGENQALTMPRSAARPGGRGKLWRRYSAEGRLLAQSQPDQEWWEFYMPNPAAELYGGQASLLSVFEAAGLVSVTDHRTGKREQLLTFDGQPVPDVKNPPRRNLNHWLGFTASELPVIYALQNNIPLPGVSVKDTPAPVRQKRAVTPLGGKR
jgi:hypothetical protein